MLKISQHRFSFTVAAILLTILVFTLTARLQSSIINLLSFPLKISSSFLADTKAIVSYKFIINENIRLKKELSRLSRETFVINELRQENERLKKLLSFREQSQFTTVAAKVIARDPNNWSRGIVIDKGFKQGIRPEDVVISESGLVGRVTETTGSISKIILINDPDSSTAAIIQRTREEGLVSGTLLGVVAMRYLEKNSDVSIGDIAVTSGVTKNYPASILIGKVEQVENDAQGLGKYCVIAPEVDLKRIEEVLVIVGNK